MTMAVCFKCGVIKFGAFVPCPECSATPRTENDFVLSLLMTDHYFDMPTLEKMGAEVRNGNPPQIDPQTRAQLIAVLRASEEICKRAGLSVPGREMQPVE